MTSRFEQFARVHELAAEVWEGRIDDKVRGELEALLRNDREARRFYLHLSQLHGRLTCAGEQHRLALVGDEEESAADDAQDVALMREVLEQEALAAARRAEREAAESTRQGVDEVVRGERVSLFLGKPAQLTPVRYIVIPTWILTAAMVSIVALMSFALWPREATPPALVPAPPARTAQEQPRIERAVLLESVGCIWADGHGRPFAPALGEVLPASVTLRQGVARISLGDHVSLLVEGPSKLTVDSHRVVQLTHGKLVGQVKPGGEGFKVITPSATVVDLGTEFGVRVDRTPDGAITLAHVFEGLVHVSVEDAGQSTGTGTVLSAGAATMVRMRDGLPVLETQDDLTAAFRTLRPGLIEPSALGNPSFETPAVVDDPRFLHESDIDRIKARQRYGHYYGAPAGWMHSRLASNISLGVALAPAPADTPDGTQIQAPDGAQVALLVPAREKQGKIWLYQSIGTMTLVDVGASLTVRATVQPRDRHGVPNVVPGATVNLSFALVVTGDSPGESRGTTATTAPLGEGDPPQQLSATIVVTREMVGQELFVRLLAHDPSAATPSETLSIFIDHVELQNEGSPPRISRFQGSPSLPLRLYP